MPIRFRIENLTDLNLTNQETFISSFSKQNALEPFDLVKGPLFRADLFKLSEDEYYLTLTAHHIVCDGWSLGIILQDLGRFYAAFTGNIVSEIKAAPTLSDYAEMQIRFSETAECKNTAILIDQFQHSVPILDLATDFPRPQVRTYKSQRLDFPLILNR
jgi:NRPS condensation-like uncharacterized protein